MLLTRPLFGVFLDSFGSMPYYEYSITEEELASWGIEQRECRDMLKLDNYASLFTGFDRKYGFETIPEKFVRGEDKTPDSFDDEISLLLKEGNGYAMVVGCSHRGIVNMVSAVKERTGKQVVRVVGGIHLVGASDERINQTFKELRKLGVEFFNLCHCSMDACCSAACRNRHLLHVFCA